MCRVLEDSKYLNHSLFHNILLRKIIIYEIFLMFINIMKTWGLCYRRLFCNFVIIYYGHDAFSKHLASPDNSMTICVCQMKAWLIWTLLGKANCPYYAKAELLADYLQKNLPDFRVFKITQHPDVWEVRTFTIIKCVYARKGSTLIKYLLVYRLGFWWWLYSDDGVLMAFGY